MERSVPAPIAREVRLPSTSADVVARILITLAFTLMATHILVATEGYLYQLFGPLPAADSVLVLQ